MSNTLNVLAIDDHHLIINSYNNALNLISEKNPLINFKVTSANDCTTSNKIIEEAATKTAFDLILLDIRLPPSSCGEILSGEDLGIKAKKLFKDVKIIVFTSYSDNFRLNNILRNINPDGFILKEDITFPKLIKAIETVLFDPPFYSKAIMKLFRIQATNSFVLDAYDRQLLYNISLGYKMKDLPSVIPLSIASLDRRKRKLKTLFDVDNDDDTILINKAREKGFI